LIDLNLEEFKKGNNPYLIGIQVRVEYLSKTDVATLYQCAMDLKPQNRTTKFLVTYDLTWARKMAENFFGKDALFRANTNIPIQMDSPSHISDYMKVAVLESHLLSACDLLLITGESSYGAIPAFRQGRPPMYLYQGKCLNSSAAHSSLGRSWKSNYILW